ncbi:MAG: DNA polymerase III subunit delta' [Vicinamibacterales bacterium]|nr:DNA polymerase III subunit delta' [Vicinamibacterales bacterium]
MPFGDIAGHARIRGLLAQSIAAGTLPPSLIFSGPEGVGKRMAAMAVAQMLNCTGNTATAGGAPTDACGKCLPCKRIARDSYADFLMVVPGDNGSIKIEQIREVIDRSIYRPFEGRRRVTIIDDADALMAAAQNALLKTLEEPPSSSVFILVTARPDMLLPTVRSRCSQIRFGRLSPTDVASVLEREYKYATRDALAVAAASDGSVGRALKAQADEFSDARGDAEELLQSARTRSDARARVERAKDLVKGGGGPAASERDYLGLRLQALSSLARDLGVLGSGARVELLANRDLRDDLAALAKSFDSERAIRLFSSVFRAQSALDRNVSPKVVADWLALQV